MSASAIPPGTPPQVLQISQSGASSYSANVTLSDGRSMTVTLCYSVAVTVQSRLQSDMQEIIVKMKAAAEVVGLGKPDGAQKLTIERDKQLQVEYSNHVVKTEQQLVKEFKADPEKVRIIEDVKTIFQTIVGGGQPVVHPVGVDDDSELISSTATTFTEVPVATSDEGIAVEASIRVLRKLSVDQQLEKLDEFQKFNQGLLDLKEITTEELNNLSATWLETQQRIQREHTEQKELMHNQLVKDLQTLQAKYNASKVPEKEQLGREIRQLNALQSKFNLATSKQKAAEGQVMLYGALIEKRLDILQQIAKSGEENESIRRELAELPPKDECQQIVDTIKQRIEASLKGDSVYSPKEAKVHNRALPQLEAANTHLNEALRSPMNWTPIYQATILFSSEGTAYTSETIMTPVGLDKAGRGIPAGLREKLVGQPINFWRTEHNIYGENNKQVSTMVSFRGGQFTTDDSAKVVLKKILEDSNVTSLHINSLLTPTIFRPDGNLLADHISHIRVALRDLIEEENEPNKKRRLIDICDKLMSTNFGVNEGAVGQLPIGKTGIFANVKMGWHTSIGDHIDPSIPHFNTKLTRVLNALEQHALEQPDQVNKLGALVHIGMELEEIWARNDFADATKGNDQFKMAAYWKVMDMLMGVTSYTNCMSGKDRTGEVESAAQYIYSELMMKMEDHRNWVNTNLNEKIIDNDRKQILQACGSLTRHDIIEINARFQESQPLAINQLVQKNVRAAKRVLNDGQLMSPKGVGDSKWIRALLPNTLGIPKTTPRRNQEGISDYLAYLPRMAPASYYSQPTTLNERHIAARNRRQQMLASVEVTRMNTTKGGFKLALNKHLARVESGFDREYVLSMLRSESPPDEPERIDLLGLDELSEAAKGKYINDIASALRLTGNKREDALQKVITNIEMEKAQAFVPQGKVKA